MPILKSTPVIKIFDGYTAKTSTSAVVILDNYTTTGEDALVVKGVPSSKIYLDSKSTDHITIKALTDVLIISDYPIDDEFEEIELNVNASVELRFIKNSWYIMSSDGLKNS